MEKNWSKEGQDERESRDWLVLTVKQYSIKCFTSGESPRVSLGGGEEM